MAAYLSVCCCFTASNKRHVPGDLMGGCVTNLTAAAAADKSIIHMEVLGIALYLALAN